MKKIKTGLLVFASIIFSNFSFSQAPTASGNVMSFSSVSSYEPFTSDESTWSSLRTIAVQSSTLTTKAEYELQGTRAENDADTLYPDFLKEVLNTDNIFQIGSYLIKIDLINDRGLIIDSKSTDAYSSLVHDDLSATGMMVLSGDEDFGLELLEALENNSVSSSNYQSFLTSRSCPGAGRQTQKKIETWIETNEACDVNGGSSTNGKTYAMDNKLVYQKAIIFFSIQSKIRSVVRCTFGGSWTLAPIYYFVDLKLTGTVKYRKRCDTEVNDNVNLLEGYLGGGNGILNWRAYSGGRSLSHYDCNVDFGIRQSTDRNPNPPAYHPSDHYRIVWGY